MHTRQASHDSIQAIFEELGADQTSPTSESVLVCDGFLVGRKYLRDGIRIVWFFDAAELKVWGPEGNLLRVIDLTASRAAAA